MCCFKGCEHFAILSHLITATPIMVNDCLKFLDTINKTFQSTSVNSQPSLPAIQYNLVLTLYTSPPLTHIRQWNPSLPPTTLLRKFSLDQFGQFLNLPLATDWLLPHLIVEVRSVVAGLEDEGRWDIEDLFHVLPDGE